MKWSQLAPFERDQLISEKIFGWPDQSLAPEYSRNMSDAWRVVDAMRSYHRPLLLQATRADLTIADIFLVQLWELTGRYGIDALFAYTPELICFAALKAVGIEIEE